MQENTDALVSALGRKLALSTCIIDSRCINNELSSAAASLPIFKRGWGVGDRREIKKRKHHIGLVASRLT